ncbi:bifunctional phosphoribosylaminoimidazolecarboxamide formyltransferase/IMP cyclohydrolase [Jatrophihabitans telluris]|uniref:Bifunctional purine biosynthesis protein PurH n=1 Tax=Jatrophihabitans telluris TaxID=2038343 RepID=A0ABY4QWK1_9ACTN|nr:bifunctional phosphoribosylaminoimidazolecarboxamide formyltransferase/IMP cyclohydrolase [Jatrophihabitans telluris]UQX87848.1 bifunctional phosphoribosylaminoimidazolecarboxamide formyltransferase/IMP cyclohydrolase [Jatrophihabitans telluris]
MSRIAVRRALVSVYDKSGLEELAHGLHGAGVEIVSTGSTAATIAGYGVPVTSVESVTGFPEILGGRVKTLHPHVHAGLLADQGNDEHLSTVAELGIETFQLVVVNLYPFRETVASGASAPEIVEQIDIGGPAMVRASAKNHGSVAVVVDPRLYPEVLTAVGAGGFELADRQRLAGKAYAHTAAYDAAVANWFGAQTGTLEAADGTTHWPPYVGQALERAEILRYGENPHQAAALYVLQGSEAGIAQAEQLHGKAMSFNNYVDGDAAYRAAYDFDEPCVAIIKHANPCGIAVGADIAQAHLLAHACDPVSAYGGVIATNRPVTVAMAEQVKDIFTEVIIAPAFDEDAVAVLATRANLRLLVAAAPRPTTAELRPISGGMLMQDADTIAAPGDDPQNWTLAAGRALDETGLAELEFAWRAVRAVKSNAILLAKGGASVGVGMGQVNRVDSAKLAVARAGDRAAGSYASSDAFFPFPDGLQVLLDAGVRAVVQPGGSIRDNQAVEAAEAAGVTMYFTGTRHFAH